MWHITSQDDFCFSIDFISAEVVIMRGRKDEERSHLLTYTTRTPLRYSKGSDNNEWEVCTIIPSFRIWDDFPPFRLLGLGVIFRRSVLRMWGNFPPFRLLGSPLPCCADERSAKTLCPSPPLLGLERNSELLGIEDAIKSSKDICRILPYSTLFFNYK